MYNSTSKLHIGHIPRGATFRITQVGEEELQRFEADDDQAILTALQTGGSLSIDEISQRSSVNKGTVERRVVSLTNRGCIQLSSGETIGGLQ